MVIKKIPCIDFGSGDFVFSKKKVRQLETDYKEAIEALEESTIELINIDYNIASNRRHKNAMITALKQNQDSIKIIEYAYGEKWEDIRREK